MNDYDSAAIRAMLDKQAITEVLLRYCRGIDRKDPHVLRSQVYWPDAIDDHVLYEGDLTGFIDFSAKFTRGMPTMHFLGNILIDLIDETHAFAETYHLAFHDMPGETGRMDLTIGGRYLDQLEKRDSQWRLKQRTVAIDWFTRANGTADWNSGLFANLRTRGGPRPDDPLYKLHPKGLEA
jgi:hypothetical protein